LLSRSSRESSHSSSGWNDFAFEKLPKPSRRSRFSWFDFYHLSTRPFGFRLFTRAPSRGIRLAIFLFNLTAIAALLLILLSIFDAALFPSFSNPPGHYQLLKESVQLLSAPGRGNPRSEKIFIASNIINAALIRGHWGDAIVELIDYLGPDNVFVSVYENDSGADTAAALREFAQRLTCKFSILRFCNAFTVLGV
jgi:Cryptococcal mannosyltransferase 1